MPLMYRATALAVTPPVPGISTRPLSDRTCRRSYGLGPQSRSRLRSAPVWNTFTSLTTLPSLLDRARPRAYETRPPQKLENRFSSARLSPSYWDDAMFSMMNTLDENGGRPNAPAMSPTLPYPIGVRRTGSVRFVPMRRRGLRL